MSYRETDSLLPRGKPAPEIQGSRPQSINDASDSNETGWARDCIPVSRIGLGSVAALLIGLTILAFIALLLVPNGLKNIWGDRQTLDDRVNRILTKTPLIGNSPK